MNARTSESAGRSNRSYRQGHPAEVERGQDGRRGWNVQWATQPAQLPDLDMNEFRTFYVSDVEGSEKGFSFNSGDGAGDQGVVGQV